MDMARCFAIMSVVWCHSVESVFSMNIEEWSILNTYGKLLRTCSFTIGRLGVPIFIFLSGALILNKNIDDDSGVIEFYKHNLFPLFIAIEIWNVIYNIFLSFLTSQSIEMLTILKNILFLEQVNMSHMWYMSMILGMYLTIPFITILIKRISIKSMYIPMIVIFIASIVIPNMNLVFDIYNKDKYGIILDLSFCGGVYGIYLLAGYFINKGILKRVKNGVNVIIVVLSLLLTIIFQFWCNERGYNYNVWYNFIGIFFCTVFLFEGFRRKSLTNSKINIIINKISCISLGIYFVHRPIQMYVCKYIYFNNSLTLFSIIILWGITFVSSVILVLVLGKVNFLKKFMFIIK